jgi:hypothetical protein
VLAFSFHDLDCVGEDVHPASNREMHMSNAVANIISDLLFVVDRLAEIGFRLLQEPIWPSRIEHMIHEIAVVCGRVPDVSRLSDLAPLGVDVARYGSSSRGFLMLRIFWSLRRCWYRVSSLLAVTLQCFMTERAGCRW